MEVYQKADGGYVVVKTGCISKNTFIQSFFIGLFGGMIVWGFSDEYTFNNLLWSCFAMALAPILVDLIRPVHIHYSKEGYANMIRQQQAA